MGVSLQSTRIAEHIQLGTEMSGCELTKYEVSNSMLIDYQKSLFILLFFI